MIKKTVALLNEYQRIIPLLVFVVIILDSYAKRSNSDVVFFGVVVLYVAYAKVYRIKSSVTYLLCIAIFSGMFMSFVSSQASNVTEKLVVWLFLFLVVGIIQGWNE